MLSSLTIVLPGFDWPRQTLRDLTCDMPTPGLTALLDHGMIEVQTDADVPSWPAIVRAALRPDEMPDAAPCRLLGLGGAPQAARWICLDPVNFSILQHRMLINDPAELGMSMDEARQLAVPLAPTFAPLGELHITAPTQWHLQLNDDAPSPGLPPLPTVIGHSADGGLSRDRLWRSVLNEAQMVLHRHSVNQSRGERGLPPINSLWAWGDGRLTPDPQAISSTTAFHASESILRGRAQHLGLTHAAQPTHWDAMNTDSRDAIVVIDSLLTATRVRNGLAWRDALAELDARWFAPLFAAWQRRALGQVTLLLPAAASVRQVTLTENSLSMRMLNQVRQWFPRDTRPGLERLANASDSR